MLRATMTLLAVGAVAAAPRQLRTTKQCSLAVNMKVISAIQSSKSAGCVALAKATVAPTSQQQCACYSTLAPVLFGKCGSSFSDSTWHGDYMSCLEGGDFGSSTSGAGSGSGGSGSGVVLAPGSGKPQCSGQHKPAPHFTGCVGPAQTAKAHLTTDWSPDNQIWGSKDPQCVCDKDVKTRLRYCKDSSCVFSCDKHAVYYACLTSAGAFGGLVN